MSRFGRKGLIDKILLRYPDREHRFDYSLVHDILTIQDEITVICNKHGEFKTTGRNHLKSVNGCYKCYRTSPEDFYDRISGHNFSTLSFPFLEEELEGKSKLKHITVRCSLHGDTVKEISKVMKGTGCMQCFHKSLIKDEDVFLSQVAAIHGNSITVKKGDYKSSTDAITVTCNIHKEDFTITPHRLTSHMQGCKKCGYKRCSLYTVTQAERNKEEFINTPSGLYVLKLSGESGNFNYKLGISKNIKSRIQSLSRDSNLVVDEIFYRRVNLYDAINIEQATFSLLHECLINDDLKFAGYTERFYMSEDLMSDFIEYLDYQITSSTNMENAP